MMDVAPRGLISELHIINLWGLLLYIILPDDKYAKIGFHQMR